MTKKLSKDQKVLDKLVGNTLWACIKDLNPYEVAEYLRRMADEAEEYGNEEMTEEELAAQYREDDNL